MRNGEMDDDDVAEQSKSKRRRQEQECRERRETCPCLSKYGRITQHVVVNWYVTILPKKKHDLMRCDGKKWDVIEWLNKVKWCKQ